MDFSRGAGSLNDKDGRPLTRQGSVYTLTFDEFQNSMGGIGKDFGSMNMDELLKNIWTAEETQAMASALAGSSNPAPPPGSGTIPGGIQRQGSLTLPRTLSQKTVDEVWRDLLRENTTTASMVPVTPPDDSSHPRRQQTLGEMTLEEFLVRAGVDINLSNQLNQTTNNINPTNNNTINNNINTINNNNNASSSNNNLFFNNNVSVMPMAMPIQYCNTNASMVALPGNGMMPGGMGMGVGSPEGMGMGNNNGEMSSSLSPVGYQFGGGLRGGKKGGPVEKVVERRQRRMIKNRESAARSRARKQAYTIELEAEVAKLKEQNEELQKKQQEIMEMQKNESMEKIDNQQCEPKKRCLRRTQTGPW